MSYIYVTNWDKFQHYRDRRPSWIKNYTELLRDAEYLELSFADRGLLHGIWLLAAECGNGRVSADKGYLRSQLGLGRITLATLIDQGWIILKPDKAPVERRKWASRYIPDEVRAEILASDQTCESCGSKQNLEVDHIIPVSRGGTSDRENLQALCRSCNRRKHNQVPTSAEHVATQKRILSSPEKEKEKDIPLTPASGGTVNHLRAVEDAPRRQTRAERQAHEAEQKRIKAVIACRRVWRNAKEDGENLDAVHESLLRDYRHDVSIVAEATGRESAA